MDKIKEVCQIQVGEGFKARVDESGNILIEKEKFVPKDGDVIYTKSVYNSEYISIFKIRYGNNFSTYCDYCIGSGRVVSNESLMYRAQVVEMRLATEEEKGKLFDKLKVNGDIWNPNTKTLEKIYIPKNGDYMFYITSSNSPVISISKGVKDNKLMSYADFFIDNNSLFNSYGRTTVYTDYYDAMIDIRLATPEEKEKLDKKLEEIGLRFNSTTKVLEKIYQPKDGDIIYNQGGEHAIAIFNRFEGNTVKTYCSYFYHANVLYVGNNLAGSDNYFCNINSFNPRLATEAEKLVLFEQLKKKKDLVWNAESKTLDAIYIPKEGDIVHYITPNLENIAVFKEIREDIFYHYCAIYKNEDDKTYSRNILMKGYTHHFSKFKEIRLATEEERNILFTNINATNRVWNSELKILCTIPKIGDVCIFWNELTQYAIIKILTEYVDTRFKNIDNEVFNNCVPYNEKLYKKMRGYNVKA